ncbi:hypothetical protein [Paenibacillus sp. GCM10012306]|uniref:hypothetical protein n=1 Tax=Paenibacillus sp. GCM10012306 TaxID=3317342 RepID=UPI0036D34D4C
MLASDKSKLDGIAAGANNYVHPATHPASIITQDASNRFVTDTEKSTWNAKETPAGAQEKANAAVTAVKADYIRQPGYAATSGTAIAYNAALTPAPTSIPDGFGITIVPHVANGANPTLSVNGLAAVPLKDQKGVAYAAGKLLVGKPYTFRRVGTDFLADSAGGSGNAVAGDIRAGRTAATDAGDITGTLPVQTGGTVTPGATAVVKPAGIYDTAIAVEAVTVPADKVLEDTTIAGTKGTMKNMAGSTAALTVSATAGQLSAMIPLGAYQTRGGQIAGALITHADANFQAANIMSGKTVLGMKGTATADATATASDMLTGRSAYVNGVNVAGTMPEITSAADSPEGIGIWPDGGLAVYPRKGYRKGGMGAGEIKVSTAQLQGLQPSIHPNNILGGASIFGVVGGIPNRSAENHHMPAQQYTVWPGDTTFFQPPRGYYSGESWVVAATPHLRTENIRAGYNILGVGGSLQPKYYAKGTTYVSQKDLGVYGIGFRPFGFVLYMEPPLSHYFIFYFACGREYPFSGNGTAMGGGYAAEHYLHDNGFSATSYYSQFGAGTYTWEAWG